MRIESIDILRADGGGRVFCYLKLVTDDGLVGWAEFQEGWGAAGLGGVIEALAAHVVGCDPMRVESVVARLRTATIQSRGGLNRQALGAYENALLDIKGKALGVPVCQLLGGPVRDRIPVYWSHCGPYRIGEQAARRGVNPVRTYEDVEALGREVVEKGYRALKTNIMVMEDGQLRNVRTGGRGPGFPELNWTYELTSAARETVMAFRSAVGQGVDIMLDLHFSMKTEGYVQVARAIEDAGLAWLEVDTHDPRGLAYIRNRASCPVASLEAIYEARGFLPFFEAYAVDVALIDVMFNGYAESLRMAALADLFEVNVAPHNFYSHFGTFIAAQFCAAVPNLRTMEMDVDGAPLRGALIDRELPIEDGHFVLSDAPGWGVEVNEEAVREHAAARE